jgi:hypothetical protein
MDILSDPRWSTAQQEFLRSLVAAGATKPEHAIPIDRASRLPARELQLLIDSGVVREAATNGYYLYLRQTAGAASPAEELSAQVVDKTASRMKEIVFWIILILIPIVLLNLLG